MKKSHLAKIFGLGLAAGLLLLIPVHAKQNRPDTGIPFKDVTPSFETRLPEGEPLSLDEATRIALAGHLGIQMARLSISAEEEAEGIARAVYDTRWDIDARYVHDREQRAFVFLGGREIEGGVRTGLAKKLPVGTDLAVRGGTSRFSTDTDFVILNRYHRSFLEFAVRQPLLKNFFGFVDRKNIEKVRINTQQFTYEKLIEIENALAEARRQYWDLAAAFERLRAGKRALAAAQAFYKITHEQLEFGMTQKTDVYAAEAHARQREVGVRQALVELHAASFRLKVLLNRPEVGLISPEPLPEFSPPEISYDEALSKALELRWDLKQAALEMESRAIDRSVAKNNLLPDLHFEGAYASTALDRDLASSQGGAFEFQHPRYEAGFSFAVPLEMRRERGEWKRAGFALEIAEKQWTQKRLAALEQVDERWRRVNLTAYEVEQAKKIEKLQQNKLEEEEKDFLRGLSSSKRIIDFQNDVIEAEFNTIHARVEHLKAVEALYHAQNRLLEYAGVGTVLQGDSE